MVGYRKEIKALKNVVKAMKEDNIRLVLEGGDGNSATMEKRLAKMKKKCQFLEAENQLSQSDLKQKEKELKNAN